MIEKVIYISKSRQQVILLKQLGTLTKYKFGSKNYGRNFKISTLSVDDFQEN